MYKKALLLVGLLSLAASAQATVIEVGRPLIERGPGGTGGRNQLIAVTDMPGIAGYPITGPGYVMQWEAYVSSQSPSGWVASVIFSPDPLNLGSYIITGMDYQSLTAGQNNVIPNPTYSDLGVKGSGGGSNALVPGAIFGLYHLPAELSGTKVSNQGTTLDPAHTAVDPWGRDLDFTTGLPPIGTSLQITPFGCTTLGQEDCAVPRTYSYKVTADVPTPATLWLMVLPLAWWSVSRRQRADTAV